MRFYCLLATTLLLAPVLAKAAPITYTVSDNYSNFSLNGTITTDGVIGTVAGGDVTGFDLTIKEGSTTSTITTGAEFIDAGGLSATATGLFFDFDEDAYFFFTPDVNTGNNYICFEGAGSRCDATDQGASYISVNIPSLNRGFGIGVIQLMSGTQEIASAPGGNLAATPEPGSLTLLGTGVLSLAGLARRRSAR